MPREDKLEIQPNGRAPQRGSSSPIKSARDMIGEPGSALAPALSDERLSRETDSRAARRLLSPSGVLHGTAVGLRLRDTNRLSRERRDDSVLQIPNERSTRGGLPFSVR